jgi:DNA-binding IclR family transcriptional regulator
MALHEDGGNGSVSRREVSWTFLSNHAHVLLCLARDPDQRLREVAFAVGITERAVQKIVADLEQGGVLTRRREGRRNRYELHPDVPLRHPIEEHCSVRDLMRMVLEHPPHAR